MNTQRFFLITLTAVFACLGVMNSFAAGEAAQVLTASHVGGGFCVVVGPCDTAFATDLARKNYVVQCLLPDSKAVATMRKELQAQNLYGIISAETFQGATLPYADNMVSLLIVTTPAAACAKDFGRVLRPGGEMVTVAGGKCTVTAKPRPKEMDEWSQWRHGADRNPVSKDLLVETPQRIQWLAFQGNEGKEMVTAAGRCFYMLNGMLRARDAFNGLPLWSKPADAVCTPVASGSNVYVVTKGTLVCLDAVTGEERRQYANAGKPNVLLLAPDAKQAEGILLAVDTAAINAFAPGTGKLLWSHKAVSPRSVCAGGGGVYFITGDPATGEGGAIRCIDLGTGAKRWERSDAAWAKGCFRSCFGAGIVAFETGKFAVPRQYMPLLDKMEKNVVHFLSATDGKTLRDYEYAPAMRHDENPRTFFLPGGKIAVHQMERDRRSSTIALFTSIKSEPTKFPALPHGSQYFYCYPPTATERFFMYGQMSFTDWNTQKHTANPITRGSCGSWSEGLIPANGLIYVFPKSCNCFSMLHGFGALAPGYKQPVVETEEFEKGPAFGAPATKSPKAADWPIHRGDVYRSGSSATPVPTALRTLWTAEIPSVAATGVLAEELKEYPYSAGVLTPPVIAEGKVFVAQPQAHRVIALNAADGKQAWAFTVNGRVDTPPTIYDGLCLFGTRMGWVYCLRAADGALAWRRRIAPADLRIIHCGQAESTWPAQGSVLVDNGTAYIGAGIHPLADGGIRVFAFDPRTGAVKWKKIVTDMGYEERGWHGRAGLEQDYFDLLVKDGDKVALSRWIFDPASGENKFQWHDAFYRLGKDGAYMMRGTWSYGYPMNRPRMKRPLMVGRGMAVIGANKVNADDKNGQKLFRRDFKPGESFDVIWNEKENDTDSRIGTYFPINRVAESATWSAEYPGWIEAMVWAGNNVFVYTKDKLHIYAAADGKQVTESDLPRPVWDGIAAANEKLFVSTRDSKVVCLGK